MKSVTLQETIEEKDLGVWISNSLKSTIHVAHAVCKANQILGLIRRSFTYLDCRLMKQLYTALVRPHIEYANVIWHPDNKKDLELIEGVQHRATKLVPGMSKLSYEERLQKMDLPSLSYRRLRGDAIEVYKYLHGIYRVDSSDLLPLHKASGHETRGHCLKLQKRECHGRLRANQLGFRIVNLWNLLPENVVTSDSVNCFKGRFDRLFQGIQHRELWNENDWIQCMDNRRTSDTNRPTGRLPTTDRR